MEDVLKTATRTFVRVGEALGIHNLDPEPGKIFVTGGSGVIGHRVALKLLRAGHPDLRLGTHQQKSLEEFSNMGAEIADFSWEDEETYEKALKGVKSVLLTIPHHKDWYKHFPAFLDACQQAGVKHIVKISFYHARVAFDQVQEIPFVRQHGDCDDQLIKMIKPDIPVTSALGPEMGVMADVMRPNMSYTILYASHYMSNLFQYQGKELRREMKPAVFYGCSSEHGVNYVSPNDVAEAAVHVLLQPQIHYNKEYDITGPEAVKDQHVADLLSKYLKKPIMYAGQPIHEFKSELKASGEPRWLIDDLAALEKMKASGREEDIAFISEDFEKICGHKPETFEQYLQNTDMMTTIEEGPSDTLKPLKKSITA